MMAKNEEKKLFLRIISNNELDLVDLIGINVILIYSKSFFKKNQEISNFLEEVYDIEFLPYVMKSRTLIVARITREITEKNEEQLNAVRKNIIEYLNNSYIINDEPIEKKRSKKKDANEKLTTWLEGL